VYVAVQLESLDALVATLPREWVLAAYPVDLLRMGLDPRDGLAEALGVRFGIDDARPIVAAFGVVEVEPARAAMRAYRRTTLASKVDAPVETPDVEAAFTTRPPLTLYGRLVLPIRRDARPFRALELVSSLHAGLGPWTSCEPSPACGPFDALGATAILEAGGATLVAFAEAHTLSIDILVRPFPDDADPRSTATALHALRATRPSATPDEPLGCDAPATGEAMVVCIDAERTAAMGAVLSWANIVAALAKTPAGPTVAILDVGMEEATQPLALADPEVRFLEAGRFALVGRPESVELSARWLTTDAGQRAFEPALRNPIVVNEPAVIDTDLLTPLSEHLRSPGHGFRDPRQLEQRILEGGWPMWPVLAARSWPNAMGVLHGERVAPLFRELAQLGTDLSVRLALTSGRLELLVRYAPAPTTPSIDP